MVVMSYVCCMKLPIVLGKGIIVGAVRLGLPADLEHARWCEIGANFCHLKHALASWIVDLVGLRRVSPRRTPEDHHRPWLAGSGVSDLRQCCRPMPAIRDFPPAGSFEFLASREGKTREALDPLWRSAR
jgi:hypothetical protein